MRNRGLQSPRAGRCELAFTLVELLVVIGIIAILLAILLPTITKVRWNARNCVCETRLRQLAAACTMYYNDFHVYPAPMLTPIQNDVIPNFVQVDLLNKLHRYLGYAEVADVPVINDLPTVTCCPFAEDYGNSIARGPIPLPGATIVLTGYEYCARLDEESNPRGVLIAPKRHADARGRSRGVLFADILCWYSGSGFVILPPGVPPSWAYYHAIGRQTFTGFGFSNMMPNRCQNCAWTDGSVVTIPSPGHELLPADFDKTAAYKLGTPGNYYAYFWF